jgi:hypothetical protein
MTENEGRREKNMRLQRKICRRRERQKRRRRKSKKKQGRRIKSTGNENQIIIYDTKARKEEPEPIAKMG